MKNFNLEQVMTGIVREDCDCFCDDFVNYEGLPKDFTWTSLKIWMADKNMSMCSGCRAKVISALQRLMFMAESRVEYNQIVSELTSDWLHQCKTTFLSDAIRGRSTYTKHIHNRVESIIMTQHNLEYDAKEEAELREERMKMPICETPSCEEIAVTSKLHPLVGEYCEKCATNRLDALHEKRMLCGETDGREEDEQC